MGLTDQFANSLGGLFGGGQQAQMQQGLSGYGISGAYGMSPVTLTPYVSNIATSGAMNVFYDYASDRPLTNAEWLDRRIDEMRVRL